MKTPKRSAKKAGDRIVLDASLLLLLVVGTYDRLLLGRIKHAKAYVPEDYELLLSVMREYRSIWVTPNGLTEVSNLLGNRKDRRSQGMTSILRELIGHWSERYVRSEDAAGIPAFQHLGLADCALISSRALKSQT